MNSIILNQEGHNINKYKHSKGLYSDPNVAQKNQTLKSYVVGRRYHAGTGITLEGKELNKEYYPSLSYKEFLYLIHDRINSISFFKWVPNRVQPLKNLNKFICEEVICREAVGCVQPLCVCKFDDKQNKDVCK